MNEEVKDINPANESEEVTAGQDKDSSEAKEKMFSQSEVDAMINKRIAKEKRRQAEANRLAALSEDDRIKEQLKLDREAFETERQEFLKEKMNVQAEKELLNNGLPANFTKYVVTDQAESTLSNIKEFKEAWDKAVEKAVNERIKAKASVPKVSTEEVKGNITWDDVLKDPKLLPKYREQQRNTGRTYYRVLK